MYQTHTQKRRTTDSKTERTTERSDGSPVLVIEATPIDTLDTKGGKIACANYWPGILVKVPFSLSPGISGTESYILYKDYEHACIRACVGNARTLEDYWGGVGARGWGGGGVSSSNT